MHLCAHKSLKEDMTMQVFWIKFQSIGIASPFLIDIHVYDFTVRANGIIPLALTVKS